MSIFLCSSKKGEYFSPLSIALVILCPKLLGSNGVQIVVLYENMLLFKRYWEKIILGSKIVIVKILWNVVRVIFGCFWG